MANSWPTQYLRRERGLNRAWQRRMEAILSQEALGSNRERRGAPGSLENIVLVKILTSDGRL